MHRAADSQQQLTLIINYLRFITRFKREITKGWHRKGCILLTDVVVAFLRRDCQQKLDGNVENYTNSESIVATQSTYL